MDDVGYPFLSALHHGGGGGGGGYSAADFWSGVLDFFKNGEGGLPGGIVTDNKGNIISNDDSGLGVFVHHYMDDSYHFIGRLGRIIIADEIFGNLLNNHSYEQHLLIFMVMLKIMEIGI